MIVCSFSSSLEELSKADQADLLAVFDCLKASGRFSSFEVSGPLCKTVSYLFEHQMLASGDEPYPWVDVKPTQKGLDWRAGKIEECPDCEAKGYQKRGRELISCARCSSTGFAPTTLEEE